MLASLDSSTPFICQCFYLKFFSELIGRVKSVQQLLETCPDFHYSESEDSPGSANLVCESCAKYKSEIRIFNMATGVFALPVVNVNEELRDLSRTNKWFSNLKVNIRKHLETSQTHVDATSYFTDVERRKSKLRDRNLLAAVTVVRTAYLSIKLGDSFSSITHRLANLSLAGVDIGQKNHSYAIPPEVVDETAAELERVASDYFSKPLPQTDKPPPFGLITDKITTGQRTRQMTSARLVNLSPDCKNSPLIINIYLGHPVSHDKSGSGLAQNIIDLLLKHNITSRHIDKRFVGFAIDGEYVNLGILQHFLDLNLIDSNVGDYYEIWDPAHVMERAVLDAFKKAPVLEKYTKWLQEIVKSVQYGNAFEELLKAAENLQMALLKPTIFKSKKFVVDVEKVYRSFFNNYSSIAAALQNIMQTKSDGKAESNLRHMTDKNFVLSVTFLSCVCSLLATHSSNFQQYDSIFNSNNINRFVDQLDELLMMTQSEDFGDCFYMKLFKKAKEQLERGEFRGVPTIGRNSLWHHYRPLVFENVFSKFHAYINGLKTGFLRRVKSTTENATLISYAGFMNVLLGAVEPHVFSTDYNPDHLAEVMSIPSANIEIAASKLCSFLTTVVKNHNMPLTFNAALRCMLIDPKMYENLPQGVVDGLIVIITIPCSEAIAETQGSSIDHLHLRYNHTDADDKRLQNELKIKLMGPKACSADGECLVRCVARKMAAKHQFVRSNSLNKTIGPAVTKVLDRGYSLPFKFDDK